MNQYHRVRQFPYTSKSESPKENDMYANYMLVASQMADRLREAENERLGRLASHQRRTARTPRFTAHRLTATGGALRAPADDRTAKVAERSA